MSYNISDNDDDLFDYDPSQETSTQVLDPQVPSSPSDNAPDDHSKHEREFIKSIKTNITDADADLGLHDDTKMNVLVSNLYGSFQEAINNFVGMTRKDHFSRSVHVTLDELTNGRFSMLNMFYYYEIRIIRRMVLANLFGTVFHDENADNDGEHMAPFLQRISEMLNITFTKNYYVSTFNVSIDMLNHVLTVDKIIYQFLADKLSMTPNELITSDLSQMSIEQVEQAVHGYTFHGFQMSRHQDILSAFFEAEPNEHNATLPQRVSEIFNTEVAYMNSMRYME